MRTLASKLLRSAVTGALLAVPCVIYAQAARVPPPAVRLDPITAIIDALETHQIVALGDWHYNLQLHELRLELIRDPRFPEAVNDIVFECGATQHQQIMDRYVSGFDVPYDELRRAWTDFPSGSVCDGAVYEEFYRAVREVNANLVEARRIRVILGGDPTP